MLSSFMGDPILQPSIPKSQSPRPKPIGACTPSKAAVVTATSTPMKLLVTVSLIPYHTILYYTVLHYARLHYIILYYDHIKYRLL